MKTIAIVYFSSGGSTGKMAEAGGKGISAVEGVRANLISLRGEDIINGRYENDAVMSALDASAAIIFASPTYMGGPSAHFKAFADATVGRWSEQKWKDKLAAGFTVSGTPSGDKFSTLAYFQTLAMQHGMIWVGLAELPAQPNGINRLGSWGGAMADASNPSFDDDLLTGEALGKRVASLALVIPTATDASPNSEAPA